MSQLSIDFARRARRTDPPTSKTAAARTSRFDGDHFRAILQALRDYGPQTIHEISESTRRTKPHLDHVQIARRCSELGNASPPRIRRRGEIRSASGEVIIHGETRPSPTGSPCAVWELVP